MTDVNAVETAAAPDEKTVRRAVAASAMGNAIEWFDYGVFTAGVMTTIVGSVLFPPGSESDAVRNAFLLLAVSFLPRPFGGAFFGMLGDKIGRRKVLATTILLMSGSTFLIGLLPSYASIGILAPILLLLVRLMQGFSTGGEYGGAATFIAEYAPTKKRGFLGAFLEFGTLAGFVFGAALVLVVNLIVGDEAMRAWGWRIPFLIALPLGLIGLYLRTRLEDTPVFRELLEKAPPKKSKLRETLAENWRMILNLVGIVLLLNVADYMLLAYMPSYFDTVLDINSTTSGLIVVGVELLMMCAILPLGALSDRVGRKPLLLTASLGFIVLSFPAFKLMQAGSVATLAIGFGIVTGLLLCILAVIGSTFPAMFPTRVRYTSFAIGYNTSTLLFGGTAGYVVNWLIDATGNNDIPAYYLVVAGLIALVPIMRLPETSGVRMSDIETSHVSDRRLASATPAN